MYCHPNTLEGFLISSFYYMICILDNQCRVFCQLCLTTLGMAVILAWILTFLFFPNVWQQCHLVAIYPRGLQDICLIVLTFCDIPFRMPYCMALCGNGNFIMQKAYSHLDSQVYGECLWTYTRYPILNLSGDLVIFFFCFVHSQDFCLLIHIYFPCQCKGISDCFQAKENFFISQISGLWRE